MSDYLCGIDIGGTFTDCVVIDAEGRFTTSKAPSTPEDFSRGMMAALGGAAAKLGLDLADLGRQLQLLSHGTTTGTNAVIQKRGAKVGLITTKGHNDVIHIMRGSRGLSGRDVRLVVHIPESSKPDPIVPKRLIRGVSERVDCFGQVVVPLNEAEARAAVASLLEEGVEAIAVCFLWSFLHREHEARLRAIVEEMAPGLFVSCSHELVPKWGEYERTAAVALNAYIGPITADYLAKVDRDVAATGYRSPLQITQCGGGTISVTKAMQAPLLTLDSGPVAGVMGSQFLGRELAIENVITTDMGGTSFDVGVIHQGQAASSYRATVNQYDYFLPKVDIQAIGSGGGSKAWIDSVTGSLKVGPDSAGAQPGPVCYGRGGTVPTVTDADLVLGYLDPDNFAGGSMPLDRPAAEAAIGALGAKLGLGMEACASGIAKIVDFQMADLIRKVTIQKGFDPRDFTLFAFGGAGPMHAGIFARELGIAKVIVPQRETASVWCAFGAAAADILHVYEQVEIMASPFDPARITEILAALKTQGARQLDKEGASESRRSAVFSLDMRHKGQINEVEVTLEGESLAEADLGGLQARFVERYELLYGRGAALPGAQLEIVTLRCRASALTPKPPLVAAESLSDAVPEAALRPARQVWWEETGGFTETPIYDGSAFLPGNAIEGPAVVETVATSVVLHPGQRLAVDRYGNFEMTLA
ncbi:MAG: hydantoinase/oxoprolinase family protein [Rhodospirillales bacterium]